MVLALQRELYLKNLHMSVDEILDRLATVRSCIVTTTTPNVSGVSSIRTETIIEKIDDVTTQLLWDTVQCAKRFSMKSANTVG
jgi:hypothetical protein